MESTGQNFINNSQSLVAGSNTNSLWNKTVGASGCCGRGINNILCNQVEGMITYAHMINIRAKLCRAAPPSVRRQEIKSAAGRCGAAETERRTFLFMPTAKKLLRRLFLANLSRINCVLNFDLLGEILWKFFYSRNILNIHEYEAWTFTKYIGLEAWYFNNFTQNMKKWSQGIETN